MIVDALIRFSIVIGILLASAFGGYVLVAFALKKITRKDPPPGTENSEQDNVLRGGAWIGVLERLAATGAVLAGQPALIAIIVAVKGLGRFDELKGNPAASEKFVVGTLLSLVWAAGLGAIGLGALSWVK